MQKCCEVQFFYYREMVLLRFVIFALIFMNFLDKKMKAKYIINVQKRTVQNERRCTCDKLFCTLC